MTLHAGASWDRWRAEDEPPLALEGTLAVCTDGNSTIGIGDGALRPVGDAIAEHVETRRDAMGNRFVSRALRLDVLATHVPPPGWVDGD